MSPEDRHDLRNELLHCSETYGPWAVLWEVSQVLKQEFERIEPKKAKRVTQALDDATEAGK